MANAGQGSRASPSGASHVDPVHQPLNVSFWIRELPLRLVLVLTVGGVAYTTFSKQPIFIYWEILAPITGLVCVWYGWPSAHDSTGRLRLIGTQILHWIAFLLVMNMVFLASVQRSFNATATGLAIFTLLALGTFTAGVHILSWQVCLLGLIMAFCIPPAAFLVSCRVAASLTQGENTSPGDRLFSSIDSNFVSTLPYIEYQRRLAAACSAGVQCNIDISQYGRAALQRPLRDCVFSRWNKLLVLRSIILCRNEGDRVRTSRLECLAEPQEWQTAR